MNLLILSNLYPPWFIGGYELACEDVVTALRRRGHSCTVVTSWFGLQAPRISHGTLRVLKWCSEPGEDNRGIWSAACIAAWSMFNRSMLEAVVRRVQPDIIHVFNTGRLGGFLLDWVHTQHIPVVHDISDFWLLDAYASDVWFAFWALRSASRAWQKIGAIISRAIPIVPSPFDLSRSYVRSQYLKEALSRLWCPPVDPPVFHHGVKVLRQVPPLDDTPLSGEILYAGRLSREKGVHVLLGALPLMTRSGTDGQLRVTLAGPSIDLEYRRELQALALALPPRISVSFLGQVPHSDMALMLRQHCVFAFPVLWNEPFSISLLEAMNAGLAVTATLTGGSAEILHDRENCLVVPPGDAVALARALDTLLSDPALRRKLGARARADASAFDFEAVIDQIERHLAKQVAQAQIRRAPSVPH